MYLNSNCDRGPIVNWQSKVQIINDLKIPRRFSFQDVTLDLALGEQEVWVKREEEGTGIPERRRWKNRRTETGKGVSSSQKETLRSKMAGADRGTGEADPCVSLPVRQYIQDFSLCAQEPG